MVKLGASYRATPGTLYVLRFSQNAAAFWPEVSRQEASRSSAICERSQRQISNKQAKLSVKPAIAPLPACMLSRSGSTILICNRIYCNLQYPARVPVVELFLFIHYFVIRET